MIFFFQRKRKRAFEPCELIHMNTSTKYRLTTSICFFFSIKLIKITNKNHSGPQNGCKLECTKNKILSNNATKKNKWIEKRWQFVNRNCFSKPIQFEKGSKFAIQWRLITNDSTPKTNLHHISSCINIFCCGVGVCEFLGSNSQNYLSCSNSFNTMNKYREKNDIFIFLDLRNNDYNSKVYY